MFYLRINLFGGLISLVFGIINVAVKIVYKVLSLFHLRLIFFALVAGGVLELFFDKLSKDPTALLIFLTLLALLAVRCVYLNLKRYVFSAFDFKGARKTKETPPVQAPVAAYPPQYAQPVYASPPQYVSAVAPPVYAAPQESKPEKPVYYRVTQNPKYVMAEYRDRYELYFESGEGLKYIKTDYKSRGYGND